jgi:hypothetical protein
MKWKLYHLACLLNIVCVSVLFIYVIISFFLQYRIRSGGAEIAGMILGMMIMGGLLVYPSIAQSIRGIRYVNLLKEETYFNTRKLRSYYFLSIMQLILVILMIWAIASISLKGLTMEYLGQLSRQAFIFMIRYHHYILSFSHLSIF